MIATKSRIPTRRAEPRRWTFAEMAAELPQTNLPTELWDGELVLSPAPSFFHQEIVARLYKLLDAWVGQHRLGKTAIAPLDMVLAPRRSVQPDVIFIANQRLGIIGERVEGAADLVIEVLFLERGVYQLIGRWQPDGQAASRLLKGFKVPVGYLFGRGNSSIS